MPNRFDTFESSGENWNSSQPSFNESNAKSDRKNSSSLFDSVDGDGRLSAFLPKTERIFWMPACCFDPSEPSFDWSVSSTSESDWTRSSFVARKYETRLKFRSSSESEKTRLISIFQVLHFHSFGLFSFKHKLEQWEKCPLGIWDIANAPKLDGWKYSG